MGTNHNRIKVADLEINEPNKTLITNDNGELEFSDVTGGGQDLQSVLNAGNTATFDTNHSYLELLSGNPELRVFQVMVSAPDIYQKGNFYASRYGVSMSHYQMNTLGQHTQNAHMIGETGHVFYLNNNTNGNYKIFNISDKDLLESPVLMQHTFEFPKKTTPGHHTFTLATLDDIDQNNFVRCIFVDTGDLPDSFTKQDVINYILASAEEDRTVAETDSKLNVLITDRGKIIKIYELQNQGKGTITSIDSNNLLLITGGLDDVLNIGKETFNKATFKSSFYPSIQLEVDYHRIYATDSDPNIATSLDSSGVGSYDNSSGEVTTLNPQGIHFNDKNLLRSNPASTGFGSTINLPITTGFGDDKTLATLDDIIGGGGSQNLQSTLEAGNTFTFDGGNTTGAIGAGSVNDRYFEFFCNNGDSGSTLRSAGLQATLGNSTLNNSYDDNAGEFLIDSGILSISQRNTDANSTKVSFYTPIATTELKFPAKEAGTYTLATLDDIPSFTTPTLQSVLDHGNIADNISLALMNSVTGESVSIGANGLNNSNNTGAYSLFNTNSLDIVSLTNRMQLTARGISVRDFSTGVYDKFLLFPINTSSATRTIPLSVNENFADDNGGILLSSITTTFTTNDGKTVTVTNGVITNIE